MLDNDWLIFLQYVVAGAHVSKTASEQKFGLLDTVVSGIVLTCF